MSPRSTFIAAGALAAGLALGLSGCITGERPTLAEEAVGVGPVGDPASDAVLELLDARAGGAFTAAYEITNNFGPVTRAATVVQSGPDRRSITIGDVRYLLVGASGETCDLAAGPPCQDRLDDAAVSDLQITHRFFDESAADRLRVDARRRVGPTEGYEAEIAGRTARCVGVPVSGGTKVYCALTDGVLAQYQGPDVLITLTGFDETADETAFSRTR